MTRPIESLLLHERTALPPIVALEIDLPELTARLAAKGIAFHYRGPLPQDPPLDTIGCELTATMDHVIFSAMAKIAFNYLAYWAMGFDKAHPKPRVGAACQALGPKGFPLIRTALKRGLDRTQAPKLAPEKRHAVLLAKKPLTPTIWQVDFELEAPIADFAPGQFARLKIGDFEWRDYWIAGVDGATVRLLISTRTGGHGSRFIITAEPGTKTQIELPLGHYTLARNPHRKVFIATGTGLVPFLPMFRQLEQEGALGGAELYLWVSNCRGRHHGPFCSDAPGGRSLCQPRGARAGRS